MLWFWVIILLYALGGVFAVTGVVREFLTIREHSQRHKRAKTKKVEIEEGFAKLLSDEATAGRAAAWKSQQERLPLKIGEPHTVLNVLQAPWGGITPEALASQGYKGRRWDLVLVGLGTAIASLASILSMALPWENPWKAG